MTHHELIPLGHFVLEHPIASGAMGAVWSGHHAVHGFPVAIKLLLDSAQERWADELFRNELRSVAGLDHPGIIRVLDHGTVGAESAASSDGRLQAGCHYLVMERVEGATLQSWVGQRTWLEIKSVLLQLLDALAHCHARGVIHRDIKPGNVLLRQTGRGGRSVRVQTLLTDFGLAQASEGLSTQDRYVAGTPAYMAPEQLQGGWRDQGAWTDLYALGCLAWALVSGLPPFGRKRPFEDFCHDHLTRVPPRLCPQMPVPERLEGWLRRLLQKRPTARFGWACDAAWALLTLGPPVVPVDEPIATYAVLDAPEPFLDGGDLLDDGFDLDSESTTRTLRPVAIDQTTRVVDLDTTSRINELSTQLIEMQAGALPLSRSPVPADWRRPAALPRGLGARHVGLNLYGLRTAALVGREEERDQLWATLRWVVEQKHGAVLVLRGSAGCGKSRLAEWLCERAQALGGAVGLKAQHSTDSGPMHGLSAMVTWHLRCQGLPREAVRFRLRRVLPPLGLASSADLESLTELISPAATPEQAGLRFGDPVERFALILRLLDALTGGDEPGHPSRPAVVWLDDVQWSASALPFCLEMLAHQHAHPHPILIIATVQEHALAERFVQARALGELLRQPHSRVIDVGPMPPAEHRSLIRQLLGIDSELVETLARRTAGNPLFAVQLIGDWVTRGILEPGPAGFSLKKGADVALPADLHQLWISRTEKLLELHDEHEAQALELAAALGNEVSAEEWRQVCMRQGANPSSDLQAHLLWQRLTRSQDVHGWAFAHPMLRETLALRARAAGREPEQHLACARMLAVAPDRRGRADRIAHHYTVAGQLSLALKWTLRAIRERLDRREHTAVEPLLRSLVELLTALGLPEEHPSWGQHGLLQAENFGRQERYADCARAAQQALERARRHRWRRVEGWARYWWGYSLWRLGQVPRAWRQLHLAAEQRDLKLGGHCLREMAQIRLVRGDLDRAALCMEQAREVFRRRGDDGEIASCLWLLGCASKQRGHLDVAMARFSEALEIHRRLGDRRGVAICTNELGEVARLRGAFDEAAGHYAESMARMQELGLGDGAIPELNLALVRLEEGDHLQASEHTERALISFEARERAREVGMAYTVLLACAGAEQDWSRWTACLAEVRRRLAETSFVCVDLALVTRWAGDFAVQADAHPQAREAYGLSIDLWRALGRDEDAAALEARLAELGSG